MTDQIPTETASTVSDDNPWRTALVAIWVLGLIVGIILIAVGANNYSTYNPTAGQTDSGLIELFISSTLLGLGTCAFMVWLGVKAIQFVARPIVNALPVPDPLATEEKTV